jgi:hypothetical protein
MGSETGTPNAIPVADATESVAQTIISAFFDQLSKEDGLAEVSDRLRKIVNSGKATEKVIREAMLQDLP